MTYSKLAVITSYTAGLAVGVLAYHYLYRKGKSSKALAASLEALQERRAASEGVEFRWLNDLLGIIWPRADAYFKDLMQTSVLASIKNLLPSMLQKRLELERCSLGKAHPEFGPATTHEDTQGNMIINVEMLLASDIDVSFRFGNITVGVRKIFFRGVMTVVLSTPKKTPPFFGGIEMYFVNPPAVDLDFTGIADIADCPALYGYIRSAMSSAINAKVVLPSRIAVDMDETDSTDAVDLKSPPPISILRLTLKSGEGLIAADRGFTLKMESSDPFVEIELGQQTWQSPVKNKTLNPVWSADNVVDLFLCSECQQPKFTVYDKDMFPPSDTIGVSKGVSLSDLKEGKPVPLTLDGQCAGSLSVAAEMISLTNQEAPSASLGGPSQLLISAKVLKASVPLSASLTVDGHNGPPFRICFSAGHKDGKDQTCPEKQTGGGDMDPAEMPSVQVQKICAALLEEKVDEGTVAKASGLEASVVRAAAEAVSRGSDAACEAALAKLKETCAAERPYWGVNMYLLLPWNGAASKEPIMLTLLDCKGKPLTDSFSVSLDEILSKKGMELDGPFEMPLLGGSKSATGSVALQGKLRAWSLQPET